MKKMVLMTALLLAGVGAFAHEGENNKANHAKVAIVHNQQHYNLVYKNGPVGKVRIELKNSQGHTIHSKVVKNKVGFSLPYEVSILEPGDYSFKITHADGSSETKDFEIKSPVENNLVADILDVNDNKKFRLLVVNRKEPQTASPVWVRIYDENNNLIQEETIKTTRGFRKTYDLSAIDSENFEFVVMNSKEIKRLQAK